MSNPMTPRTLDGKGRLTLGKEFANRTVLIRQESPTEWTITLARVITEREAWLLDERKAARPPTRD